VPKEKLETIAVTDLQESLASESSSVPSFNIIRTVFSTSCLIIWTVFMIAIVWVTLRLLLPKYLGAATLIFHRVCCRIFSIRRSITGRVSVERPTLFVINHISYLDIFVLGSVIPGCFIAKSEVAKWPILGSLAKFQNTLFFERNSRKIRGQLDVMSNHFRRRGNLILFPEGTTTEGEHVARFKSGLFQAVENIGVDVQIQPVTIAYTHYQDRPMSRQVRDVYAWYDDMPFVSHFFRALGLKNSRAQLVFHKLVTPESFETRKACAHHCWQQVSDGLKSQLKNSDRFEDNDFLENNDR
jgi:1-acyl-sn-glycerol-3-phosphate acyltransferase